MPKRGAGAEEYESDGGFVDDAPKSKSKKVKTERKSGNSSNNGPPEWELSKNKRVQISEYKGKNMVDIRETYEKDGEKLPGRKGITLPIEQFQTFVDSLPEIILALQDKSIHIEVPKFDTSKKAKKEETSDEEEEEEVGDDDDD